MALRRDVLKFSNFCNRFDIVNLSKAGCIQNVGFTISVRTAKHYNPKFKWLRGKKFIDIILPHTEEAKRTRKELPYKLGIYNRYWRNRPLTITSASELIDPYKPEEGDGKGSILSAKRLQSLVSASKTKVSDMTAIRKIKNYDPNFKKDTFVQEAQDIYIKAHTALMKNDPDELIQFVTERALMEMTDGMKNKTIRWKFINSIEPPVLVQARTQEIIVKTNLFSQLTVRFHTKQSLAIYDRFGRLMHGSEILAKDVLEYVIFEKHISNEYGVWKLHGKIIPEGQEQLLSNSRTYLVEDATEDDYEEDLFIEESDPEPEHTSTAEIASAESKAVN